MASGVTYEGDIQRSEANNHGLFAGQKLWFSRSVPSRDWLMRNAELNGAQLVQLEQQADVKLVDHARKNQAPGTHSYRYVEWSIRNGKLEDLDAHRVGSATSVDRPVGSVITASRGRRTKFTDADDQMLWNWIKPFADAGGAWQGTHIYRQLADVNPRHTYQSWRERWLKHTQYQQRHVTEQVGQNHVEIDNPTEQETKSPKRRRIEVPEVNEPQQTTTEVAYGTKEQVPQSIDRADTVDDKNSALTILQETDVLNPSEQQSEEGRQNAEKLHEGDVVAELEAPLEGVRNENTESKSEADTVVTDEPEFNVAAYAHRFPLAYDFTQEEAAKLYKATCYILNTQEELLDISWTNLAKECGHTKEAWRQYFEKVIVPEYRRRNNIETDEELEIFYKAHVNRRQREQMEREQRMKEKLERELQPQRDEMEINGEASELRMVGSIDQVDGPTDALTTDPHHSYNQLSPQLASPTIHGIIYQTLVRKTTTDKHLKELMEAVTKSQADMKQQKEFWAYVKKLRIAIKKEEARRQDDERAKEFTSPELLISTDYNPMPPQPPEPESMTLDAQLPNGPAITFSQPPRPNESRKLTQSRTSESITKQSQPKPQPKHNPVSIFRQSQRSQDNSYLLEVPETEPGHQDNTQQFGMNASPMSLQNYNKLAGDHGQFVTQVSFTNQDQSEESNEDLQDIQYRPSTPLKQSVRSELLRSAPEEFSHSRLDIQTGPRPDSSPIRIHLLDEEEAQPDEDQLSDYAPSEAPSDAIHFESQLPLSQVWETTPDMASLNESHQKSRQSMYHADNEYETAPQEAIALDTAQHQISYPTIRIYTPAEQSTVGDFETAPSDLQMATTDDMMQDAGINVRKEASKHLDTQALFHQPTQDDFAELAAIPEPPDGWDDDEDFVTVNNITNEQNSQQSEADWTLPLPDPSDHNTIRSSPQSDDGTEIDIWLSSQAEHHPSIPSSLLKPLSHRALESTSMDIHLASAVLNQMLIRFNQAQYPSPLTLAAIKSLPKRDRKKAIARIVDDLVPDDVSGCWTRADDSSLLSENGREVDRVETKHGFDRVRNRFEFLELWYADKR